jgi:hypothetical protein
MHAVAFVRGVRAVDVRFGVLGELEVLVGGQPVALSAGRLRTVLAVLLLRANRVVSVEEMADRRGQRRGGLGAYTRRRLPH